MSHVIEHTEDPVGMIEEARRILKPGGKLIIETPDFECGVARLWGDKFRLLQDMGHISLFGMLGLHRLLIDTMFEVEKIDNPYFGTPYHTREYLDRLDDTDKISPPFYGNVMTFFAYKK